MPSIGIKHYTKKRSTRYLVGFDMAIIRRKKITKKRDGKKQNRARTPPGTAKRAPGLLSQAQESLSEVVTVTPAAVTSATKSSAA